MEWEVVTSSLDGKIETHRFDGYEPAARFYEDVIGGFGNKADQVFAATLKLTDAEVVGGRWECMVPPDPPQLTEENEG